jgi:hypothetical protein
MSSWCTCAADSTQDDGGMPMGCAGYVSCISAIVQGKPDAGIAGGTPSEGMATCNPDGGSTYTSTNVSNGNALWACIATSCAAQCQ